MRPLRIARPGPIIYVALILSALLAILPAAVRASVPDEIVNESAARLFASEVYESGNLAMVPDLVASNAPLHAPDATRQGPADVSDVVTDLRGAFPNASVTITELSVQGELALARWTLHGTFMVQGRTGLPIAIDGQWILQLREGMIVELWLIYDAADLARQIEQAVSAVMEYGDDQRLIDGAAEHPQEWDWGVGPACGVTDSPGLARLCPAIITV